ncbi:phosphatidylserine decarboxylase-domain-containing protein [Gymnopilus junonius]|uniref:Phosphatidylserine decarboxylase-domain-containing protein n=1 Tax=Gymnopilus junonius TaxID=109634 RepID=A0A9P5N6Y3_GYMJU|nr:phosphatidylserine decarboxylase-domain-containing protein [Gymnopilus junonius]
MLPVHCPSNSPTLCPSAEAFRKVGWLPANDEAYNEFIEDLTDRTCNEKYSSQVTLLQPIQDFKAFIENDPTVHQEFICMFEGTKEPPTNYNELCNMFNDIFRKAPCFSAFTKESLNFHFKRLFDTWGLFLSSKASRDVLVADKFDDKHYGWFSEPAKAAMMAQYHGRTFEEFRDNDTDRPVVGGVSNTTVIGASCEAVLYNFSDNVQSFDTLFIKGEGYSLKHLLHNSLFTEQFEGGCIIQGYLNITGYHRWHAPVNGTIVKVVDVPGTYFAQAPSTIGDPIPDNDRDPSPYLKSLVYFSNIAARQIIFIEADNKDIGLIFLIFIGMNEISTCEAAVCEGQHVERGDDLGMFHFGGSSFALGSGRTRRKVFCNKKLGKDKGWIMHNQCKGDKDQSAITGRKFPMTHQYQEASFDPKWVTSENVRLHHIG